MALDRASLTPASSHPPMGALLFPAQGAPLLVAVALDEVRTIMCKDSTPTDARTTPWTSTPLRAGFETCGLLTIRLGGKIATQPGGGGRVEAWRRLWVSGLQFLNTFLSLTHQHNKKKVTGSTTGFKKMSSALIQDFRFLFLPLRFIFLSLLFYRIL